MSPDKRAFQRFHSLSTSATLWFDDLAKDVRLVNISLRGARLRRYGDEVFLPAEKLPLTLELNGHRVSGHVISVMGKEISMYVPEREEAAMMAMMASIPGLSSVTHRVDGDRVTLIVAGDLTDTMINDILYGFRQGAKRLDLTQAHLISLHGFALLMRLKKEYNAEFVVPTEIMRDVFATSGVNA